MNNPAPEPTVVPLWTNDGPALWQEVEAPKWQPNRTAWLLTCVDLTSLLVAFFVLMFSTQTMGRDKWQAINGSFQARFASQVVIVPMMADGGQNAEIKVVAARSGLGYLNTLLHQRVHGDAVWGGLVADPETGGQELTYQLPATLDDDAAWTRLGGALRGFKNPVGVRVLVAKADALAGAQKAVAMAQKLSNSGVMDAFADVRVMSGMATGAVPLAQLVVRGQ